MAFIHTHFCRKPNFPVPIFKLISSALAIALLTALSTSMRAAPQDAQICVARLDGASVYHWRVFTSVLPDDVDRAMVLREFRRRGFTLKSSLVDEAMHEEVAGHYAGDEKRLTEALRHKGVQLADFRRFITEEIIISAMLYQSPRKDAPATQAEWLANLRKGAHVELLAKPTKS